MTSGRYIPLNDAENLSNIFVGGTRQEKLMEKMMAPVHRMCICMIWKKYKKCDDSNQSDLAIYVFEFLHILL